MAMCLASHQSFVSENVDESQTTEKELHPSHRPHPESRNISNGATAQILEEAIPLPIDVFHPMRWAARGDDPGGGTPRDYVRLYDGAPQLHRGPRGGVPVPSAPTPLGQQSPPSTAQIMAQSEHTPHWQ